MRVRFNAASRFGIRKFSILASLWDKLDVKFLTYYASIREDGAIFTEKLPKSIGTSVLDSRQLITQANYNPSKSVDHITRLPNESTSW